jgi:hypothetical protein
MTTNYDYLNMEHSNYDTLVIILKNKRIDLKAISVEIEELEYKLNELKLGSDYMVYVLPKDKKYHIKGCRYYRRELIIRLPLSEAKEKRMTECKLCFMK